jgi:methionyl-tRNA formyltransferase
MRIVFMGTPDFAVASLAQLVAAGQQIVAVVTAPDKPTGRGLQLSETAVKKYALSQNIPVLQPEKLKAPDFLEQLKSYKADLQIVVAFRMLPEVVWAMPPLGTFNLHASLLPKYRGAAPINWAIINGETETGLSTFFLQQEIDTGSLIFQEKTTIGANENVGDLYARLMAMGAKLVLKTVEAIAQNQYPSQPQAAATGLPTAPKIFKETCQIDWNKPAGQVRNFIRGLSPYPAAWTYLAGKTCKIFDAYMADYQSSERIEPGQYIIDGGQLYFACSPGYLAIADLQIEGKKRLEVAEFLRGFRA